MHTMPCMGADCSTYSNGKHCDVLFRWRSSYSLLWKLVTLYTLAGILQMCCMPCWPAATTSTMEQQVQVLQVCPSWSCLSHLLSLTCRLKVCKLVEPWVHEQHCACQQFINTLLYCIQQVLKPHQNLDIKVVDAEAICMHLWLLQSLLQCRLQDRCRGHSSWCEGLVQGKSAVCGAEAAEVPRLQH